MTFVSRINRAAVHCVAAGAMLLGTAVNCEAAFTTPGWARPANDVAAANTLTTYQAWNFFVDPDNGENPLTPGDTPPDPVDAINYPDVAEINPNGPLSASNPVDTTPDAAYAYDTNWAVSGSFLTGTGNIYSPAFEIKPQAVVPGYGVPGQATKFLVQVESRGSLIDVDDLEVNGTLINTLPGYSYTELSNVLLPGGFGGNAVEHAWTFTVPADQASFTLDWGWGVSSASFASLAIDTQVVPEPGTATIAVFGGMAVFAAIRRKRQ